MSAGNGAKNQSPLDHTSQKQKKLYVNRSNKFLRQKCVNHQNCVKRAFLWTIYNVIIYLYNIQAITGHNLSEMTKLVPQGSAGSANFTLSPPIFLWKIQFLFAVSGHCGHSLFGSMPWTPLKTSKPRSNFFLALSYIYKIHFAQKMVQNGHFSSLQWSEQSTGTYRRSPPCAIFHNPDLREI